MEREIERGGGAPASISILLPVVQRRSSGTSAPLRGPPHAGDAESWAGMGRGGRAGVRAVQLRHHH